jgi:aminoglycoside phosphotransferase (APT) family kinase protein
VSNATLEEYLPDDLRGPATAIARIAAGLSGAGVYRVETGGRVFVLKISNDSEPLGSWRRKRDIQQLAANAGLAPRIVHVDESRRAVVSDFVVDRSFFAVYGNPSTRDVALAQLGRTLRRVHELPLPSDAATTDPRAILAGMWSALDATGALPTFVGDAVRRELATDAPPCGRATVLSHNDVNPTNLVYDGENFLLLDWDVAAPNDRFYDLAAISVFLRMDEDTCRKLLAAHDDQPVAALPARFAYDRRLVAVLCGTMFLHLAGQNGFAGPADVPILESAPSLGDCYQRMRAGELNPAAADGQWWFGIGLIKDSVAM